MKKDTINYNFEELSVKACSEINGGEYSGAGFVGCNIAAAVLMGYFGPMGAVYAYYTYFSK